MDTPQDSPQAPDRKPESAEGADSSGPGPVRLGSLIGRGDPGDAGDAIDVLFQRGAHFVLCGAGKRPIWRGWQSRRPPADLARFWRGRYPAGLGLVPWSIRTTAVDVDWGDPTALFAEAPPWLRVATRRAGGVHAYYGDVVGRRNGRWRARGCEGDIRGARGFVLLHGDAPERAAHALATTDPGDVLLPDLFGAAGIDLPFVRPPEPAPGALPSVRPPSTVWVIEETKPGRRHFALFDTVRFHAYGADRGGDWPGWVDRIVDFARGVNARFPEPETDREVMRQALSIATWVWAGGGPVDHSPAAQRRRGRKSGKVRRVKTAAQTAAVLADVMAGMPKREAARKHGLTESGVRYLVKREAPLLTGGGGAQ